MSSRNRSPILLEYRNIYKEISEGENAIPALRTSIKFEGSIRRGVDEIKKRLKAVSTKDGPGIYIIDRPENRDLVKIRHLPWWNLWRNDVFYKLMSD